MKLIENSKQIRNSKLKALFISTILMTTLIVTACNNNDKTTKSSQTTGSSTTQKSPEEIMTLSQELTEKMEKGEFFEVSKYFTDQVKSQLNDAQLKDAFDKTVAPIGKFKKLAGTKNSPIPIGYIVNSYAEHESNTLKITYTWNKDTKIEGLWISYAAEGESPVSNPKTYETGGGAIDKKVQVGLHKLNGLIATPNKDIEDKKIIAILVQGSGSSDMDETIGANQNKIFRDIASGLAKNGISTLRYNKRFYQFTNLAKNPKENTIQNEVTDDFKSAVKLIKSDQQFKNHKIVVIGHSLGGMLTPYLSSENPEIKKAVSLAGSVRSLWDIIYDQNEAKIKELTNETEQKKADLLKQVQTMVDEANKVTKATGNTILNLPDYYVASLNNLSLNTLAEKSKIPYLILQGKEDFQVSSKDFESWKSALKNNKNATFIEYPGLNHLFMKSNGDKTINEYNIKSNVEPKVISDIADFLSK